MRTICLTGATGFLGRTVAQRLHALGYRVVGLVRRLPDDLAIIPLMGDLVSDEPFTGPELPFDAVIHCAGHHPGETEQVEPLHVLGTERILAETRRWGVRRFIYISAIGASMQAPTRFQASKWEAEQMVAASGLDYTILRPHIMFGPGSRMFDRLEAAASKPWAVLPQSNVLLQPIYVGDVAEIAIRSLWLPRTVGNTYDLAGPQSMRLEDIVKHIARDLHWFHILTLRVPKRVAHTVMSRFGRVGPILNGEEWDFIQHEVVNHDSRWLIDYGLLPRTLAIYYAPLI